MKNIFDWLLGIEKKDSRESANSRMKLMVIHDRAQLPTEVMAKMKAELLQVIAKYFEVDPEEAEFLIETHDKVASIVTNAPLRSKFVGDTHAEREKIKG